MSVTAIVKPKGILSKKLKLKDFLAEGIGYGTIDEYYRLNNDETGDYTLVYDREFISRGIEISFEQKNVSLKLALPNCRREIELFYMMVARACNLMGTKTFFRDDEMEHISDVEGFIQADVDASRNALASMEKRISSGEADEFVVFGAINPIYIGLKELSDINGNLDKFGEFLNQKQQIDAYYAVPHIYQKQDGTYFGVYFILADTRSVVPNEPKAALYVKKELNVENWYVRIGIPNEASENSGYESFAVHYEDFIGYLKQAEYYDVSHVLINMSKDEIRELHNLYGTNEI